MSKQGTGMGILPYGEAAFGRVKSVQLLIDRGAQTNVRNLQDETPLHKAAGYRRFLVAESLLQYGANPTIQDRDGRTPLDNVQRKRFGYWRGERCTTIAELIQKYPFIFRIKTVYHPTTNSVEGKRCSPRLLESVQNPQLGRLMF
ncbi:hypothetical protein ABVK25_000012 [Lepraria finkii]|uniref:Uncharacterized protein n=1 Tax=Lepraria finkii TaxID=1340010 RepID=A0ABR4BLQ1_9LECA